MAIRIPSSLGGVSIFPGGISGPLSKLFNNKFQSNSFHYPQDLAQDTAKRHYIEFNILEQLPVEIPGSLPTSAPEAVEQTKQILGVKTKTNRRSSIYLNIPDTVNVQYNTAYDELSATQALGLPYFLAQGATSAYDNYYKDFMSGNFKNISNKAANDPYIRTLLASQLGKFAGMNTQDLLLKGVGMALNPQLQVIFKQVSFRVFQFDFILTPYSKQEADMIKKIVYEFKYAAAPEIQKNNILGGQGLFFKVPDSFSINFFYNGRLNTNIHQIGNCVLENVNVDYAPMGWITFNDGNPVQTRLTLQFKETEIIDKTKIRDGGF